MTNLDEVVQVAEFAHIRDSLLFGHILKDLSHVLRGVCKKKLKSCEVIGETRIGKQRYNVNIRNRTIFIIVVLHYNHKKQRSALWDEIKHRSLKLVSTQKQSVFARHSGTSLRHLT